MLEYRNSPVAGTNFSPAQMLMSRQLRDVLPRVRHQLKPTVIQEQARKELQTQGARKQNWYNRTAKFRPGFKRDENVLIQNPRSKTWESGKIVHVNRTPRSYTVRNDENTDYIRNSIHLRRRLNTPVRQPVSVSEDQGAGENTARASQRQDVERPTDNRDQQMIQPQTPVQPQVPTAVAVPVQPQVPTAAPAPGAPSTAVTTTRSGRQVRPPSWQKDFHVTFS
jgi:hypothetical protein